MDKFQLLIKDGIIMEDGIIIHKTIKPVIIYRLLLSDNTIYIGQTCDLKSRVAHHRHTKNIVNVKVLAESVTNTSLEDYYINKYIRRYGRDRVLNKRLKNSKATPSFDIHRIGDKTKTQKAISAYKYYKLNPTLNYVEIAKMYGIGDRVIKSVRFLDIAGFNDIIELLHKGGAYNYEAYNKTLNKMVIKQTTSIQTVEKILKGTQKDVDYNNSLDELDCMSKDTNPQLMEVFDIISKLSNKDIDKLKQRLKDIGGA